MMILRRRFAVVYDTAEYSTEGLIAPGLAKYQGRALYVFNSAEFSEKDFVSPNHHNIVL